MMRAAKLPTTRERQPIRIQVRPVLQGELGRFDRLGTGTQSRPQRSRPQELVKETAGTRPRPWVDYRTVAA